MIGAFIPWSERSDSGGYVIDGNGCHVWVGSTDRHGYGNVNIGGRLRKVHRVRYEREVGPIPEGMVLDHFACDNGTGGCCNPRHCRPVTRRENNLRSETCPAAIRRAQTHCVHGHPLSGDNVIVRKKDGTRACRTCSNAKQRERRRRRRLEETVN